MPPKQDVSQVATIKVRVVGGNPVNPAVLAPKTGPLGLSPKKIGDDIAKATVDWKGLRVSAVLTVQNRQAKIAVVPSASALIIKALNEPPKEKVKGEKRTHTGNLTFDDIKQVAKVMRRRSNARHFKGTVKEILGSAVAVGVTVEGEDPREWQKKIDSGEIEIEEYEAPPEKEDK